MLPYDISYSPMDHNFHHSSVDRLVGFFHVSRLFVVVPNITSAALSILTLSQYTWSGVCPELIWPSGILSCFLSSCANSYTASSV